MKSTIGKLLSGKTSLGIVQDRRTGGSSINSTPVLILGGDSWKIGDNVHETAPEIHKHYLQQDILVKMRKLKKIS